MRTPLRQVKMKKGGEGESSSRLLSRPARNGCVAVHQTSPGKKDLANLGKEKKKKTTEDLEKRMERGREKEEGRGEEDLPRSTGSGGEREGGASSFSSDAINPPGGKTIAESSLGEKRKEKKGKTPTSPFSVGKGFLFP